MKSILSILVSILVAGCSVAGQSNVATPPYTLLKSDGSQNIEVRHYAPMVLVSTSMPGKSGNSAFRKLFKYIGGENEGAAEISMTAPVFMNESADNSLMSFVMPDTFTLETTPKPTNPEIWVSELKDYKVAAIQFSGTLSENNVEKHTKILADWITLNGYCAISEPVKAGYNGPMTLPWVRRNEVFIEVK